MNNTQKKPLAEAMRRTKIETTYEYVPIIGEVLGYWKKVCENRIGNDLELHINTPLTEYDRVIINGNVFPREVFKQ